MAENQYSEKRDQIIRDGLIDGQKGMYGALKLEEKVADSWINFGDEYYSEKVKNPAGRPVYEESSIEILFNDFRSQKNEDTQKPFYEDLAWKRIDAKLEKEGMAPVTAEERTIWNEKKPEVYDLSKLEKPVQAVTELGLERLNKSSSNFIDKINQEFKDHPENFIYIEGFLKQLPQELGRQFDKMKDAFTEALPKYQKILAKNLISLVMPFWRSCFLELMH